jgi:hypothetical protein
MTNEYQAGKIILSQIGMFNEAANLFGDVVQPAILQSIDKCIEDFASSEQWIGRFEFGEEDEFFWLAPNAWNVSDESDDPDADVWFQLESINDDEDDYWTALLCNQGSAGGEAGFMFYADNKKFGRQRAWNNIFNNIDENLVDDLKNLGFKIVDSESGKKTFFLPIHLDAMKLAETWGNDGEFSDDDPCFDPLKVALQKLKMALPTFDAILKNWPVRA